MNPARPMGLTDPAIVYVVDDDASVGEAVTDLLGSAGLTAHLFPSAEAFLQADRPDLPSCLILDVRMPGMSGLDLQRQLMALDQAMPIIFMTAHGDVPTSVRAMKAGAIEFLTKPFNDNDLLDAVHAGLEADKLYRCQCACLAQLQERFARLDAREKSILNLLVSGLLNKQVAGELGVSEITVKVRRRQIMQKMQAGSFADLVRMMETLRRS
ncbi:MAG: response regulator transcription factor [Asticcacaulis sp.]|uniref:response regulator transcription factor n=1 Tax=Asticcacaulis sp. TaxID=1872648 RepID=UPI003F7BB83E